MSSRPARQESDSQPLLLAMCVADLPVAVTPLWQLTQVPVTPLCVKVAGVQAVVPWQVEHSAVVGICVADFPLALVPLWQLEQVPVTSAWLTAFAGDHAVVVWQSVQFVLVAICAELLPVALVPLWQETQVPVALAWLNVAGVQPVVE